MCRKDDRAGGSWYDPRAAMRRRRILREPVLTSLYRDTRGLSAAEYIILMALICVVGFIAWRIFGHRTHERASGAHGVVSGLATTSSADGESGAHGGGGAGAHGEGEGGAAGAATPGGAPHGGRGDIPQARRMSIPGQEGDYGEDEEVRRSRTRARNFRWVVIGVLTAAVLAVLLGKKRN